MGGKTKITNEAKKKFLIAGATDLVTSNDNTAICVYV